jgi:hypothetical protein
MSWLSSSPSLLQRKPILLMDKNNVIITVLAGCPKSAQDWDIMTTCVASHLKRKCPHVNTPHDAHRATSYMTSGISYGGGQTVSEMFLTQHGVC